MNILVSYAVSRNGQNGVQCTIHNTIIEFNGPAATDWNASDVLNRLIWTVKTEMKDEGKGCYVALINYWTI